jgi:hypothetical protein
MYLKKPKFLFQLIGLIVLAVVVLYLLIFLEKSMFAGRDKFTCNGLRPRLLAATYR